MSKPKSLQTRSSLASPSPASLVPVHHGASGTTQVKLQAIKATVSVVPCCAECRRARSYPSCCSCLLLQAAEAMATGWIGARASSLDRELALRVPVRTTAVRSFWSWGRHSARLPKFTSLRVPPELATGACRLFAETWAWVAGDYDYGSASPPPPDYSYCDGRLKSQKPTTQ